LGEPSGSTAYDWTGFDDLALNSGVTRGAPGAIAGDTDGASSFDGSAGSAVDPSFVVAPDLFTEEAWFRTTSTTGGKIIGFGDQPTGNSGAYDRHLYLDGAGHVYFGVYHNGLFTTKTSGTFNDGQWHHVAGTLDGTGMTLYVDGKKIGQNTGTTVGHPYSGYWRIGGDSLGGWPADGSYFNGDIDDVAIYNKSLTLDQIVKHYTDSGRTVGTTPKPTDAYGKAVYDSAPDFYWRLGESSGTLAKDVTSNEADGLYSGGVTFGTAGAIAGTADKAVTLNGSDGAVATSDLISNPTVYSQELWFKTAAGYAAGGKLIGFGNAQTGLSGAYDRHVYMFDDGRLRFGVWSGAADVADTTKSYNDGNWHQLVATQGADGMKLYVDGTLEASNPQTAAAAYDGYWRVGGDNTWGGNSSNYFAGAIDEVAVYSTVLDANTIQAHYQVGSGNLPNQAPKAAFTSSATNLQAAFDGSGSQDTDGTISSYAWDFGDSTAAGSGATPSHSYATAGTYTVKLTVTDDKGATDLISHDITVTAPTELAADAFNRSVTNGWGTADVGGSWTVSGTSSNYGVGSGVGTMQLVAGSTRTATLNSVSATNVDVVSGFRFDKAATGGGFYTSALARRAGTSDYRLKVQATASATTLQFARTVNGTETVISSQAVAGMVYAPGDEWNIRFQVQGTGTTTLRAKIWKAGTTEPSTWRLTATDTTASLQGAGAVGIAAYLSGSATNAPVVLSVLDYTVKPLA
jgi:PKD repeat protein